MTLMRIMGRMGRMRLIGLMEMRGMWYILQIFLSSDGHVCGTTFFFYFLTTFKNGILGMKNNKNLILKKNIKVGTLTFGQEYCILQKK